MKKTKKNDQTTKRDEILDNLRKELSVCEDQKIRALADYNNLKKRYELEKINFVKYANEKLLINVIGLYNELIEAQKHIKHEGLTNIVDKFYKILQEENVDIIDPKGKKFDPNEHEAIDKVKGEDQKIMKVYRKGYKLNEKIVLPAIVAVGNGKK